MSKWLGITAGIYDFFFILFDNIEGYIPVWVIVNQINIKIIYLYMRSFINRNAIYNITIIFKTIEIRSVYIFNYFRKRIKANWIIFSCDKVTSYFFDNSNTLNMVWVMVRNWNMFYFRYFCLLQATAMSSGVSISIFISSIYKLSTNRSYLPPFVWLLHIFCICKMNLE